MKKRLKGSGPGMLMVLGLCTLILLALVAIEKSDLPPETKKRLRDVLLTGGGLALAVLLGGLALAKLPWAIAAAAAAVVLVATGAYSVISRFTGLPDAPGGSSSDAGQCPDGFVYADGFCLGIDR